jgi:uncharacterized protein YhaN
MRISNLELIRYGKFSDDTVEFPQSTHDFHFLVGPNEAGKSTIKTAITELLFGMPHSSPLDFIHPQSELRLGATLESAGQSLSFHRSKARRSPLSTPSGDALPNEALAPFLGAADKAFFEQMFCLDHTALVKGGQSILDASSDVGQVLFQSAAGIASLGRVRDRLAEEADRLWAKRKSSDRAYYVGQKQLDDANAELRAAVVRTSAWRTAQAAVDEALERKDDEERRHGELELKRSRLERIRRVAHHMSVWRERAAELQALGDAIDLPADADSILQSALSKLAASEGALKVHTESAGELQVALESLAVDHDILSLQSDIEELEAARHRCGDYETEIARREQEIALLLRNVADACAQLEWPQDEQGARDAVPGTLALQTVSSLMVDRGRLEQTALNAEQAVRKKIDGIDDLSDKLQRLPLTAIPDELQLALRASQRYRDSHAAQRRLEDTVRDAERALDASLAALGEWTRPVVQLKSMTLPSAERIASLRAERDDLVSRFKRARDRFEEATGHERATAAELDAFEQAHQIVTREHVLEARGARDAAWGAIRRGTVSLADGASGFEMTLHNADELSDRQVGSVTEATQLSNLKQRVATATDALARHAQHMADTEAALTRFDAQWQTLASSQHLAGMTLDDITSWTARRDSALHAADALDKCNADLKREAADIETCRARLAGCVADVTPAGQMPSDLDGLCAAAERYVSGLEQVATKRLLLEQQLDAARADLVALRRDAGVHHDAYGVWKNQWSVALAKAGLSAVADSGAATEAAIGIAKTISEQLDQVTLIRSAQIDVMRSTLNVFAADAKRLATQLDVSLPEFDARGISVELARRLTSARDAQTEAQRLAKRIADSTERVREARADVDDATARLRPLYALAAVDTPDLLRPLIARSDAKRELLAAIERARSSLANDGDGLSVDELAAEVDAADLQTVQADLLSVSAALADSVNATAEHATVLASARQQLAAIAGGANAATAEAKRQEALAVMAEAAERFIKVETASTLLRWAVDRYRERRQGPMLSRASTIFAELTLGAFARLSVDYDRQPMALSAIRTSGERVEISGMSEGTRDQLYMALRLAALELHCEQTSALPFVADDLFVNFDDKRSRAGLRVLAEIAKRTQVIFLSHHDHLVDIVKEVFGAAANIRYIG